MERRKSDHLKSSPLPHDYLRMVGDVFNSNFDSGLKALTAFTKNKHHFEASGEIFATEIVLCVSLLQENQIAATTIYASTDYDPKASSPTVEDLLAACVDAIGSLYSMLVAPETRDRLEQLADESLSALENVPFEWTSVDVNKRKIYVKIDKANPKLDQAAEQWLAKNDPNYQKHLEEEQKETEKLFVTGPITPGKPPSGTKH